MGWMQLNQAASTEYPENRTQQFTVTRMDRLRYFLCGSFSEFTQSFSLLIRPLLNLQKTQMKELWRKGLTFQMYLKYRVDFKNRINFSNSN